MRSFVQRQGRTVAEGSGRVTGWTIPSLRRPRAPMLSESHDSLAADTPANGFNFKSIAIRAPEQASMPGVIHRKCACDEDPERPVRRLAVAPRALAPDALFRMATRGVGQRVPYRREMETAFGEHFGDVQAYFSRAEPLALLGAEAATRGGRVAFRDASPSKETVAHELAHVVQERHGGSASPAPARLSTPEEPAEREATGVALQVAQGGSVRMRSGASGVISRQPAKQPSPAPARPASVPGIPAELAAEIEAVQSRREPDEDDLRRLGRLAVQMLGATGVVALARRSNVPGAERREREVEASGGTIHRQGLEAAGAVAGTMWWLTLVDGPLPVGDIIYGALILGAAVTATMAVDAVRRRCSQMLTACLESPQQPDWNREDFGPRKDCGACYRECVLAAGVWPEYKCPS